MKAEINVQYRRQDYDLVVNQFRKRGIYVPEFMESNSLLSSSFEIDKRSGITVVKLSGPKEYILEFVFSLGFYTGKMFNKNL